MSVALCGDTRCVVRHRLRLMQRSIEQTNKLLGLLRTAGLRLCANGPQRRPWSAVFLQYAVTCLPSPLGAPAEAWLSAAKPLRAASGQIAFGFLEKNRRWAGRDHAPRSQRRCGMVGGGSRLATPVPMIGMVGGRACLWLRVDDQWSMVVAIRSRSMGSEAREGMVRGSARIRCCRGIV